MKVVWGVKDKEGSLKSYTTVVDDYDLECCENKAEREQFIRESIDFDFETNLVWYEIRRED